MQLHIVIMNSVYDDIFDQLECGVIEESQCNAEAVSSSTSSSIPTDDSSVDTSIANKKTMAQIRAMKKELEKIDTTIAVPEIGKQNTDDEIQEKRGNLLDPEELRIFLTDIIPAEKESKILSRPILATATISGVMDNVDIDEHNIDIFEPTDRVVVIESNFGRKEHPSYKDYVNANKQKKSTRGRKPKPKKPKKERKKQGSGKCFNSQVTFIVLSDIPDKTSPSGFKEYKFKVFRKNKQSLPGGNPENFYDVLTANYDLMDVLNTAFHPEETDPMKKVHLKSLCVEMKNYKFFLKMKKGEIIDLNLLKKIFLIEKIHRTTEFFNEEITKTTKRADGTKVTKVYKNLKCICKERNCNDCYNQSLLAGINFDVSELDPNIPDHPPIFDVGYTSEDSELFVRFSTPTVAKPDKTVRVNIFPGSDIPNDYSEYIEPGQYGGKINILGGLHEEDTIQIYEYLSYIFDKYYDQLIIDTNEDEFEYILEEEV